MEKDRGKDTTKKYINAVYLLYLLIAIILLSFSMYTYQQGFHNSDLGWNIRYLGSRFGTRIWDTASDGNNYTGAELITMGNNTMNESFFVAVISSFIIGFCMRNFFNKLSV